MGSSVTTPKPADRFGPRAFALEAVIDDDNNVRFVPPPTRAEAMAAAARTAKSGSAASASRSKPDEYKPLSAHTDDDNLGMVWETCPLRAVMTREALAAALDEVNAMCVPLFAQTNLLSVTESKRRGKELRLSAFGGPGTEGNAQAAAWPHHQMNQHMLAHCLQTALADVARLLPNVRQLTMLVHTPKPFTGMGFPATELHLMFLLAAPIAATVVGGAGGAGGAESAAHAYRVAEGIPVGSRVEPGSASVARRASPASAPSVHYPAFTDSTQVLLSTFDAVPPS